MIQKVSSLRDTYHASYLSLSQKGLNALIYVLSLGTKTQHADWQHKWLDKLGKPTFRRLPGELCKTGMVHLNGLPTTIWAGMSYSLQSRYGI